MVSQFCRDRGRVSDGGSGEDSAINSSSRGARDLDTAAVTPQRIGIFAVAGAGVGAGLGALAGAGAIASFGALGGTAYSMRAGTTARAVSEPSAMAIAVIAAAVVAVAGVVATGSLAIVVLALVAAIPTVLGSVAGVFLVCLGIRFSATFRHFWAGWIVLPTNTFGASIVSRRSCWGVCSI